MLNEHFRTQKARSDGSKNTLPLAVRVTQSALTHTMKGKMSTPERVALCPLSWYRNG